MAANGSDFVQQLADEIGIEPPKTGKVSHVKEASAFTNEANINALLCKPACTHVCLAGLRLQDILQLRTPLATKTRKERRAFMREIPSVRHYAECFHAPEKSPEDDQGDKLIEYGHYRFCATCFRKAMGIGKTLWQKILREAVNGVSNVRTKHTKLDRF
jgi:hypothetical protein